ALGLQVVAGVLGFGLHVTPLFTETSSASLVDRVVYGPPVLAPLLFANMAVPGALGLWGLARGVGPARAGAEQVPRGAA
ncbi:MAG: hypothetical protein PVF19_14680, partial [Gemmatimonadota bacterium]